MKEQLQSHIRHFFTGLAFVGGFLADKGLINAADAEAVNAAGASMVDGSAVITGALAASAIRLIIHYGGKLFGIGNGSAARLLLAMCAAGVLMGGLPSCTTVTNPDGTVTKEADTDAIEKGVGWFERIFPLFRPETEESVEVVPAK